MSDIFISYASAEPSWAAMLAQKLEGQGWSVFWDRTIPAGKKWHETIGRELDDARCVIVLWTKASIISDWVREEADDARRRGILVPILIENVQPPIGFRSIQAARLMDWDGTDATPAFRRLIADIATLIVPPPKEAGKEGRLVEAEVEGKADEQYKRDESDRDADAICDRAAKYMFGLGVAEDRVKARELYEQAAAKGNAEAMNVLGGMYFGFFGYVGVAQDLGKSHEWYEKAAAKGNADAMCSLGDYYNLGFGVAQDSGKALEWYTKAAAGGNAKAMYTLGHYHELGIMGVPQDYTKAREWYEMAAAEGYSDAEEALRKLPIR